MEPFISFQCEKERCKAGDLLKGNDISTNLMLEGFRRGLFQRGGQILMRNDYLYRGECLDILLEDEQNDYEPVDLGLKVLYEDPDFLAIDKPPGLCMHSYRHRVNLTEGISFLFHERRLKRKIRFVNRLDMDTSGIVLIAKHPYGQHAIEKRGMKRAYRAVVVGHLKPKSGLLKQRFAQDPNSHQYILSDKGKEAITEYRTMDSSKAASLLEIELKTGRTHQIRAAMAAIGHPIFGDGLYGGADSKMTRQALHASHLAFYSLREERLVEVFSELPEDMEKLWANLR